MRRIFLTCGILSPLLYALADLLAGLRLDGYSFRDQTISELGAIGAASRPLFSILLIGVYPSPRSRWYWRSGRGEMDAPRVDAGLVTPWLGVKERIFWYAYQLWFAILALTLLRQGTGEWVRR